MLLAKDQANDVAYCFFREAHWKLDWSVGIHHNVHRWPSDSGRTWDVRGLLSVEKKRRRSCNSVVNVLATVRGQCVHCSM